MSHSLISRLVIALFFGAFLPACDQTETTPGGKESRWHHVDSTDPADGSKTVHMMIAAENRLQSQKNHAALVLSCEGGTTDVYIIWRQYLGSYDLDVTWRVGSAEEVTELWKLSTDSEAIFAPEPVALIKSMMANEVFLIKTAPFGSGPKTLVFNTAGLEAEITPLQEACAW